MSQVDGGGANVSSSLTSQRRATAARDDSYYEAIAANQCRLQSSDSEGDGGGQWGEPFSRGDRLRASLPIVKSPNKSRDKPLGECRRAAHAPRAWVGAGACHFILKYPCHVHVYVHVHVHVHVGACRRTVCRVFARLVSLERAVIIA